MWHCVTSDEGRSQTAEVASDHSEHGDKSLSTQRLFAAFSLTDFTAGNQSDQKSVLRTSRWSAFNVLVATIATAIPSVCLCVCHTGDPRLTYLRYPDVLYTAQCIGAWEMLWYQ